MPHSRYLAVTGVGRPSISGPRRSADDDAVVARGTRSPVKRFESLESLRGIAALLVVFYHAGVRTPFTESSFVRNCHLMVDFFFVLSGFVIFHSYGHRLRDRAQLLTFTITRFGRVYPLHFVMLWVFLAIEAMKLLAQRVTGVVPADPAFSINDGRAFLTNLFLVQALGFHDDVTFNYPSWSVSTEFFTYQLFALVFLLARNHVRTAARWIAPALSAGAFAVLWFVVGSMTPTVDFGVVRCAGGFFLGVFAYQIYLGVHRARPNGGAALDLIALVAFAAIGALLASELSSGARFLLPPLFALLVVVVAALDESARVDRVLRSRPLAWLGQRSYSVYMVHAAIIWVATQVLRFGAHVPVETIGKRSLLATDETTGAASLVLVVVAVLWVSNWTFRRIEDEYRSRSRAFAGELVGRLWRPD